MRRRAAHRWSLQFVPMIVVSSPRSLFFPFSAEQYLYCTSTNKGIASTTQKGRKLQLNSLETASLNRSLGRKLLQIESSRVWTSWERPAIRRERPLTGERPDPLPVLPLVSLSGRSMRHLYALVTKATLTPPMPNEPNIDRACRVRTRTGAERLRCARAYELIQYCTL